MKIIAAHSVKVGTVVPSRIGPLAPIDQTLLLLFEKRHPIEDIFVNPEVGSPVTPEEEPQPAADMGEGLLVVL